MAQEKEIPEIFRYEKPEVPPDCKYIISPSILYKFFTNPGEWYKYTFLGETDFKGNTATLTGTICHHIYETLTKGQDVSRTSINAQLAAYLDVVDIPDADLTKILTDYPLVSEVVVNEYVIPHNRNYGRLELEKPVYAKVADGIYIAGHCDRIEGTCLVDFKTVGSKPNGKELPYNHKLQLMAYTYALRQMRYEIDRIRVVYGVKPTLRLGARCFVVTESITYEDEKMFNKILKLVIDTIQFAEKHPECNHVVFKDYSLKEKK